MKFHTCYLLGLGGTGSIMAEPLVRMLNFHKDGTKDITFVDGDKFEAGNAVRQLFPKKSEGENKAVAIAKKMDFAEIRVVPNFVDFDFLKDELGEAKRRYEEVNGTTPDWTPLVISAVDNIATRKALVRAIKDLNWPHFVVIDPGNELDTGSSAVWMKKNGVEVTLDPMTQYPEMYENPPDVIPGSCNKKQASTPQLITANMGAAWISLLILEAILSDKPWYDTVRFSCVKFKMAVDGDVVDMKLADQGQILTAALPEVAVKEIPELVNA